MMTRQFWMRQMQTAALQTARDNYLASTIMTAETVHNGFDIFHPVGFPRKMDIKRKVEKYGAGVRRWR